jgi:signal transduction histidine kinase
MRTIRRQLTRRLLLSFTVLLGLIGLGLYLSIRAALLREFDNALRTRAMAITLSNNQQDEDVVVDFSARLNHHFGNRIARDFYQMWNTNGTVLERSESLGESNLPCEFGAFRAPKCWDLKLPSGFAGRAIELTFTRQKLNPEGTQPLSSGKIYLVVASDRRRLDKTGAMLGLLLAASGLLLLLATGLGVPRVLRRELAPLNQLADQAARITANSLGTRFPTENWPGELTPISRRLNDLLARLEQSFERERSFSADLAHELRTPIAELRSLAELALKWPEAREERADREVLAIAVQMEGLVTRLLTLLRSEGGLLLVTPEQVKLEPLTAGVWKTFAYRAAAKRLHYSCKVPDDAEIETDPVLLRSILTNLMDNAVEYTPPGGMVRIDSRLETDRFTLRVANTFEHLTREDVCKLFDRFWRKDPARSDNEHRGLGLSLSRSFAHTLRYELAATIDDKSLLILALSGPVRFISPGTVS